LSSLECQVTLLTNFEPISDPMDWEIGTHGLRISFIHNNRRYGATYLPDVAREQGWTKEETMVSLMRKGGWNGRSSEWRGVKELKVIRYQGYRETLEYKTWREWRSWVVETGRDEE
jgi:AMMECR1 domain-containing protein